MPQWLVENRQPSISSPDPIPSTSEPELEPAPPTPPVQLFTWPPVHDVRRRYDYILGTGPAPTERSKLNSVRSAGVGNILLPDELLALAIPEKISKKRRRRSKVEMETGSPPPSKRHKKPSKHYAVDDEPRNLDWPDHVWPWNHRAKEHARYMEKYDQERTDCLTRFVGWLEDDTNEDADDLSPSPPRSYGSHDEEMIASEDEEVRDYRTSLVELERVAQIVIPQNPYLGEESQNVYTLIASRGRKSL